MRIGGWIRIFLLGMESPAGPAGRRPRRRGAGLDGRARSGELARLIFSLDLQAKNAAREAAGGAVDVEIQDEIGQAAAVQGHVRLLVEALAETLTPRG